MKYNIIDKVDKGVFKYYIGESMKYIKNFESFNLHHLL